MRLYYKDKQTKIWITVSELVCIRINLEFLPLNIIMDTYLFISTTTYMLTCNFHTLSNGLRIQRRHCYLAFAIENRMERVRERKCWKCEYLMQWLDQYFFLKYSEQFHCGSWIVIFNTLIICVWKDVGFRRFPNRIRDLFHIYIYILDSNQYHLQYYGRGKKNA